MVIYLYIITVMLFVSTLGGIYYRYYQKDE